MDDRKIILKMMDITMSFGGNKVLRDVNFDLYEGEIHSLIGANGAGKSTLIKILNGIYIPSGGIIEIAGETAAIHTPKDAERYGLAFVHQELNVCDYLSVAENIYIGNLVRGPMGLYDKRATIQKATELLDQMQIDIDAEKELRQLRNAEKQIIEILKALTHEAKIIVLDEPTSALNEREKENFFRIVRNLKKQGVSIIFISHFLEDVIELSDRVSALRDGVNSGSFLADELKKDDLIVAMMGKQLQKEEHAGQKNETEQPVVLEVKNLNSHKKFSDISLQVHAKSMIGICGLLGAGKTEIARAIYGLDPIDSGEIFLNGEKIDHPTPSKMIERQVVMLTEDRKLEGFVPLMSIRENITLSITKTLKNRFGFMKRKKQTQIAEEFAQKVTVKMESVEQLVSKLSGGNQQKVIIARCLAKEPKVFLLDEPTRGVDVYAKSEIYHILRKTAEAGTAILIFSSELEELLENCSQIIVLKKGQISKVVDTATLTKNDLLGMIG